jgi:hypothetical protein
MGRRNRIVRRSPSRRRVSASKKRYKSPASKFLKYAKRMERASSRFREFYRRKEEQPTRRIVGYEPTGEPIWGT